MSLAFFNLWNKNTSECGLNKTMSKVSGMSIISVEPVLEPQDALDIVSKTRQEFNTGITRSYEFRAKQLKNLERFLRENEQEIADALYLDFRKPPHETYTLEVDVILGSVKNTLKHLKEWMRPEKPSKGLINILDQVRIYSDPLGVVLVIGAWNYPIYLTLGPLIGAIAGGNCCIIKPSEIARHTAQLLYNKLPQYLDKSCFLVFLGGIPETTDLLNQRFDYVFFTGSPQVGRIVYCAAANNLTPCTLELGGKCPTYIDETADIRTATRRILWGKLVNCGQTCVAPDYVLCNKLVEEKFIHHANILLKEFYGDDIKESKDFARIIGSKYFHRLTNLIRNAKVAIGGETNAENLYISPTILIDVKPEDEVMKEEIFGPILPILTINDPEEAIKFINQRDKPLAMYIFTMKRLVQDLFLNGTSCGGVCVNDTLVHLAVENLPFGGVGNSGMGSYHGKNSFDTFVHKKSVLFKNVSVLGEKSQEARYPPYQKFKTTLIRFALQNLTRPVDFSATLPFLMFIFGIFVTIMYYQLNFNY